MGWMGALGRQAQSTADLAKLLIPNWTDSIHRIRVLPLCSWRLPRHEWNVYVHWTGA